MRVVALVVLAIGVSALAGRAAAAPTVKVWFLQGEHMTTVARPG